MISSFVRDANKHIMGVIQYRAIIFQILWNRAKNTLWILSGQGELGMALQEYGVGMAQQSGTVIDIVNK